jgi:hypothetical protein
VLGVLSLRWDRRIQCREVGDGWVAGPVTGAPRAVGARCVRIPALDPPLPSWHPRQRDAATIGLDSSEPADSLAPTARVCRSLGLVAAVTALWGLALFVTDSGPSGSIWVWPGDLLTSRLIAVMLLTIAVGAVYALRSVDVSRVMLGVILQHSASCSSFPRPY